MDADKAWEGIITGAPGGASAGLILAALRWGREAVQNWRDTRRVVKWLEGVSELENAEPWRSTHAIARYADLTEEPAKICSILGGIEVL